jgi:hypothetical protein
VKFSQPSTLTTARVRQLAKKCRSLSRPEPCSGAPALAGRLRFACDRQRPSESQPTRGLSRLDL